MWAGCNKHMIERAIYKIHLVLEQNRYHENCWLLNIQIIGRSEFEIISSGGSQHTHSCIRQSCRIYIY